MFDFSSTLLQKRATRTKQVPMRTIAGLVDLILLCGRRLPLASFSPTRPCVEEALCRSVLGNSGDLASRLSHGPYGVGYGFLSGPLEGYQLGLLSGLIVQPVSVSP